MRSFLETLVLFQPWEIDTTSMLFLCTFVAREGDADSKAGGLGLGIAKRKSVIVAFND